MFNVQGTSADQDNRFSDKEKKLLKQMKFEDVLLTKIDMKKVKLDVLKPWLTERVAQILGMEDDVLVEFIFNQLELPNPDPRKMQINLTGFVNGKNARLFMAELWQLLDSAQKTSSGIPQELIDKKKEEMKNRSHDEDRIRSNLKKLADDPEASGDQKPRRRSRSPPSRRRSRSRDRGGRRRSRSRDRRRSRSRGRRSRSREKRSRSRDRDRDRKRSPKETTIVSAKVEEKDEPEEKVLPDSTAELTADENGATNRNRSSRPLKIITETKYKPR